jgi:N-acetylmuramoyl-L-alanine amidase
MTTPLLGQSTIGPDGWKLAEHYALHVQRPKLTYAINYLGYPSEDGAIAIWAEQARRYWTLGEACGIRPEVLWLQMSKETNSGRFCAAPGSLGGVDYPHGRPGVVHAGMHNPAGIKKKDTANQPFPDGWPLPGQAKNSDYNPNAHETFANWDAGIRAHFNHHLAAIYGKEAHLHYIGTPHARTALVETVVYAGTRRTVEDLNGKWAPSPTYGDDLVRLFLDPFLKWCADLFAWVEATSK